MDLSQDMALGLEVRSFGLRWSNTGLATARDRGTPTWLVVSSPARHLVSPSSTRPPSLVVGRHIHSSVTCARPHSDGLEPLPR